MNSLTMPLRRTARRFVSRLLDRLPTDQLQSLLVDLATQRARSLKPSEGLRFSFGMDAALYPVQGQLAVAYGNGTHTKHRHTRYHDFFVERISPSDRVLDIGCGIGALAYDVAEKAGASVVGIDLNSNNIAQARQQYAHPRIKYCVGDVLQDLPGERFDVAILSNVLEHLPERPQFLRRLQSTVHPSRILIRVPLFERDWRVPLKQELGVEWRLDPTHETEYTLETFAAELSKAGMKTLHQEVRWSEIWTEVVFHAA